jgi:outer membrane protein assembly factor BamB
VSKKSGNQIIERKRAYLMRDAGHDLSQHDSAVEITPLTPEKELPAAQKLSRGMVHESARQLGRANRSGSRRYILIALALCLVLALFLTTVVVLRHQTAKPSSHASSLVASPTPTPPSYVPTDYSVNTTIVNGVAYAGAANGAVYALRTIDGNVLWRHKIDPGASTAPLVSGGIIYITASISDVGPGTLYALHARDGVELWHYTSRDPLSSTVVANGIVYVTSYDVVSQNGSFVALQASNGTRLWHDTARGFSYNTPVVDNQIVYVSATADNGSGMVYALRASNGAQLWHYTTTTFTSVPLVVNGIAYLVSDQGLLALQASNGQLLWRVPVVGNTGLSPQLINGVLYLTTTTISLAASASPFNQVSMLPQVGTIGNLLQNAVPLASLKQTLPLKQGLSSVYAVRISDGAVLWHYSMSKENGNNWANWLSIVNGTVYVGTYVDQDKSYIYALRSSDGSLLWRQATLRGMSVNAFVAKGIIYIASFINNGSINNGSGAVYALHADDGSQLWYHPMYWVVYNPPMLVGATIYVSTAGGEVYAFQASNGSLLWHFHTDVQ